MPDDPSDSDRPAFDPFADETERIETSRYTPPRSPQPDRTWDRPSDRPAQSPERWFEPVAGSTAPEPASSVETVPVAERRHRTGFGPIAAVSLLSAVLASVGTAFVLGRSATIDAVPATVSNAVTGGQPNQPVTISENSAIISAAAKVSPAVVKIEVQGASAGPGFDPFGSQPVSGIGSGVIFDPNGWILTNKHVVTGSDQLTVELKDGRSFAGKVYGIDTLTDLAIVKIDAKNLPAAAIGTSDGLKVGQLVVAIGSPLGTYSFSVTAGIVSGTGRSLQVASGDRLTNLIQTDAAINPGNSGGPLIDAAGDVVGINTAVARDGNGIGFAIAIDIARPIMEQAKRGEALARPFIGIRFVAIDHQLADQQHLPVTDGALLATADGSPAVNANSPAAAAGLKDGDIVTAIEGVKVDADHPLEAVLARFAAGRTVTIDVLRGAQHLSVQLKLGTRPDQP
jgi:serine protease Do